MSEWSGRRLELVGLVKMGQSPPGSLVSKLQNGLPFLQGNGEFGPRFPSAGVECDQAPRRCEPGDLLMSVRAPVGDTNEADRAYGIGRGLAAVRFTGIDPAFGNYALRYAAPSLQRVSQGTTFSAVGRSDLAELTLLCPASRSEQQRIAEILDTIDETIRITERLIAKKTLIRTGLGEALLLGPEEVEGATAPAIAVFDWLFVPVRDVAEYWNDGDWIESPFMAEEGIRLIQTGNIGVGEYLERPDHRRYVSDETFRLLGCSPVRAGDVLISRLADPVGRACIVPESVGPAITAVDCTIFRPDKTKVDRSYLRHWMSTSAWLHLVEGLAAGTTRKRISRSNLGGISVPLPPLGEQQRIAEILDVADDEISVLQAEAEKLRWQRVGLAEDLLSGRVRTEAA